MTLDSWPETWETMTLFLKSKLMRALRSFSMFHSWLMALVESSFLEPRAAVRGKERVLGLEDLSSDITIFKEFWRRSWTWDSMPWEITLSGLKALMILTMVGLVLISLISSWERPEIGDFFRVWYWMPVWPSTLVATPIFISKPRALVEVKA